MAEEYIAIMITAPSEDMAAAIARDLVEARLAACANIIKGVRSIYRWDGQVQDDPEIIIIIKSRREHLERISARVAELHSYSVPEVIALPIVAGLPAYLAWIGESTS